MKWGTHINTITNKANKTLGFLWRNLKIGNKKTKEIAYKALVRLILGYAVTVWDPYTENEISSMEKVQHRVARRASNRHHQTFGVNSVVDSVEWPTLQQCHRNARLEMFFKFHHVLISISSSYLSRPTSSRRSSRKNNDYSYDIPSCQTHHRQMSFFPRTIPDWNSLPQEIVAADTLDCFKSRFNSPLKQ